jgi:fructokinase
VRIGVDLGGTKIEAIALDSEGREVLRLRCGTPAGDYPATLEAIAGLVEAFEREFGPTTGVGVGTPGSLSPADGRIRNANSVCLNGQRLDKDLASRLRRPVRIANDADCFALSEAADGAAAGAGSVFGVILGTGTGGGIVINGRLLEGPNAIAGEWGHNPLPWPEAEELPGPVCYCGKRGCIETFLSGPGLALERERRTGRAMSAIEIVDAALGGDAKAETALEIYEDRLARGLASAINLLDPQLIVLGGGMSNIERLYRNVPTLLPRYVFSDVVRTRVLPPEHGDSSGVRGAAWLWPAADDGQD